ncbi:MAG: hypothetical protein AAGB24_07005 [Bacteroidota bacterium]
MKNLMKPALLAFCLVLGNACSNDSEDDLVQIEDDDGVSVTVTYDDDIRPIMSASCTSCHSNPPTNGAPMPLTTYEDVVSSVETRDLVGRINSTANPMPQDGLLPVATRNIVDQWVSEGLPEN